MIQQDYVIGAVMVLLSLLMLIVVYLWRIKLKETFHNPSYQLGCAFGSGVMTLAIGICVFTFRNHS